VEGRCGFKAGKLTGKVFPNSARSKCGRLRVLWARYRAECLAVSVWVIGPMRLARTFLADFMPAQGFPNANTLNQ
jgi:hypothetical protein